jgi:hypothetical protein
MPEERDETMKRVMTSAVVGMVMGIVVTAWAEDKFPRHPNLQKAYVSLNQATKDISAAQVANEFDMDGHAAQAKGFIAQAQGQLDLAAAAANANAGKKK